MATSKVFPYEKMSGQSFKVSLADALVPMVWVKQVLFWRLEKPSAYEDAFEDLREGLRRLATEIPTLAGHLTREHAARPRDITITISIDASIDFASRDATARKSTPSFDHLDSNGFPIEMVPKDFFPKASAGPVLEGSPMFCAQLNQIKGGAVLVFCFNHVLSDGWSQSEIERLWALHTSDAAEGIALRRHKTVTPDGEIRRQLSTPRPVPHSAQKGGLKSVTRVFPIKETFSYLHPNSKSFKAAIRKIVFALLKRLVVTGERPEPRGLSVWMFSPQKLAELKQAASDSNGDNWISTKDALAGLFWSRIMTVQDRKRRNAHKISRCLFALNIRKRLTPNIPDGYIGNVVGSGTAQCTLAELCSGDGVRCAAQSLRRANQDWSEESFNAGLHAVLNLPEDKGFGLNRDFLFDKWNIHYNDYSSFQSNILEWGPHLGIVARTRYPNPGLPAGALTLMVHPRFPDGGLEVSLTCTDEMRRGLDNDEIFRRYARFVCQGALASQWNAGQILMRLLWWAVRFWGGLFWKKERTRENPESTFGSAGRQ